MAEWLGHQPSHLTAQVQPLWWYNTTLLSNDVVFGVPDVHLVQNGSEWLFNHILGIRAC